MKKGIAVFLAVIIMTLLTSAYASDTQVDGEQLKTQMDEYITTTGRSEMIDEIIAIWSSNAAKTRIIEYESLPSTNGKITMGTAVNPPFSCYENEHYGGISVEIVYRFCKEYGYGLEVVGYSDINSLVMAIAAGKCDIGGTTITITEERKKSVDFSVRYADNPFVLRVRDEDTTAYSVLEDLSGKSIGVLSGSIVSSIVSTYLPDSKQLEYNSVTDILYALSNGKIDAAVTNRILSADISSAFTDITASIEIPYENPFGFIYPKTGERNSLKSVLYRTFLENDRWSLFLGGIWTTIEISLSSIVLGTLLGFAVYCLFMHRPKKGIKVVLDAVLWIVRCTPAVLFLMIFYYVVFGSADLGGTAICIVAFSVLFAAAFLGCFSSAMGAIDPMQDEASLALGYTPRQSFFRILVPQALIHLWPDYQNAVINHIKATSIVGYVAVIDVTKAGDMIRSSTYDALVPLISAAVFYFAVIWALTFLIRLVKFETEPSERSRKRRIKGVREHD